jgi:hypothetical protein
MSVAELLQGKETYRAVNRPHVINAQLSWIGGVIARRKISPGSWNTIYPT